MKLKIFLSLIIICLSCILCADNFSDYMAKDDGVYKYKLENTQLSSNQSVSISHIKFTSQVWLDKTLEHAVDIYYPSTAQVKGTALMLVVSGEYNSDWLESATYLSTYMQAPIVVLYTNPINESNIDLGKEYIHKAFEDDNILKCPFAYACTKTIIKAMDTVGNVTHELYDTPIDHFVLCGGEFYGLPIWLSASLNDYRIRGIIPVCFDFINVIEQFENQKEFLGEISEAVINNASNAFTDLSKAKDFIESTDPFYRLDKITVPKLIVSATADPMVTIDAKKFYVEKLVGTNNHFFTVINENSVWPNNQSYRYSSLNKFSELLNTVKAFFYNVSQNKKYEITNFEWVKTNKGYTLNVNCNPLSVVAAYSYVCDSENKDFRYSNFNKKELSVNNNQYSLDVEIPDDCHRCAFVEIQYTSEDGITYSEFSTPFIIK